VSREQRPRYELVLEALPAEQDADYRLRGALQVLLRRFRLKCRRVVLVEEPKP